MHRNRVTLTFWPDLWVNACWATTIEYMCTKLGVDSSSCFLFTVRQIDKRNWTPYPHRRVHSRRG